MISFTNSRKREDDDASRLLMESCMGKRTFDIVETTVTMEEYHET